VEKCVELKAKHIIEETPPKKAFPEKEMLFWRKEISYPK
jgi:hypothetical protein